MVKVLASYDINGYRSSASENISTVIYVKVVRVMLKDRLGEIGKAN